MLSLGLCIVDWFVCLDVLVLLPDAVVLGLCFCFADSMRILHVTGCFALWALVVLVLLWCLLFNDDFVGWWI